MLTAAYWQRTYVMPYWCEFIIVAVLSLIVAGMPV
jgi:hypothetical protein